MLHSIMHASDGNSNTNQNIRGEYGFDTADAIYWWLVRQMGKYDKTFLKKLPNNITSSAKMKFAFFTQPKFKAMIFYT